ncbi:MULTISPECIES: bifunctional diguanylate cyclase/phosphodiesterase [unclassified Actinoplanes]|uniref:putative bifunctional diguanylate cyclase/phosphodiesterase n=1 Tax=unclassified Actinoplanes TaxID=2626549 RepID=UPI000C082148|nr:MULTISPECIES: bifunctional diguanylate cyclase/phosphodiesterase [unclassified Actinoplanes]
MTREIRDRAGAGLVAVAVLGVLTAAASLPWGARGWLAGSIGGAVVAVAATVSCLRLRTVPGIPSSVRRFWQLWAASAALLFAATLGAAVGIVRGDAGMQVYEAVPALLSVVVAVLAFRYTRLGRRTAVDRIRLILDGAAIAVAGALLFGHVVIGLAPPDTPLLSRWTVGAVGVGCLLALVVFGRAAASPGGRVDPGALGILAGAPLIALVTAVSYLSGSETSLMLLSMLGYPLVALAIGGAAHRQAVVLARAGAGRAGRRPRGSLLSPVPFLAVAGTVFLVVAVSSRDLDPRGRAVLTGVVLIAALVLARQLLNLRENGEALRDIRRQQAELEQMAVNDPLTGLVNRSGFNLALARRLRDRQPVTALVMDVDDFTRVNDTLGPAAGDVLLGQIAERLRKACAAGEIAARLAGDEFAVLLPSADRSAADLAAARFQELVRRPVSLGGQHLLLHASIGVAIAVPGETADEVLRNAGIAMSAAKDVGQASYVRFEPGMRHNLTNHARIAGELHDAIYRGELRLLYQPVFDLETGRLHGAEALVRWQHPARGFISPGEFVPVAERSGLIVPLGAWVLRESCEQLARWRRRYGDAAITAINVNVAVRQLRETTFVAEVAAILAATGLEPNNLVLEVTESSVADGWRVRETLQSLHDMGIRLALDDFGTGHSSLSLLRAFPVDVLKLDKSFVDGIADGADRGRLAVAAAVAQLAEHLQLKAVAEGIETQAQQDRLRDIGYRYGQGFHLARPLPADECAAIMAGETVPAARQ